MAPRANWRGYLRLSLVSCPIALYPARRGARKSVSIGNEADEITHVGELGWPLVDDGRPSNSSRARSYIVPAVSERRFLELIGKVIPDAPHKTYSAGQLGTSATRAVFSIVLPASLISPGVRSGHVPRRVRA
jgi:hypothetical protein